MPCGIPLRLKLISSTQPYPIFISEDRITASIFISTMTRIRGLHTTKERMQEVLGKMRVTEVRKRFFYGDIYLQLLKQCGRSTADGTNNGIVTWADIPTNITFMPYIYTSVDAGVKELIKTNFENKVAIYQRGTTIMRVKP